jgi:hypothetical protein
MAVAFNSTVHPERERKKCRKEEIQDHGIYEDQSNT